MNPLPLTAAPCGSCPFGPNGVEEVATSVKQRILTQASQTCHSTGAIHGRRDTHLCRGARDFQLQILHRMGLLSAPTDDAWDEACVRLGVANGTRC